MAARYFIQINGGSVVTCQSLKLSPVTLTTGNMQPGELAFKWHHCGAAAGAASLCPIQHDDLVKFWDGDPGTSGELLFIGLGLSPVVSSGPDGLTVQAAARDALRLFEERLFVRGDWWPGSRQTGWWVPSGGFPPPNYANQYNTDVAPTKFYGHFWQLISVPQPSGPPAEYEAKQVRHQTIPQALEELVYYHNRMAERDGLTDLVLLEESYDFGDPALKPEPSSAGGPMSNLKWLVAILSPQLDGFARVSYHNGGARLHAGRFRDQAPVDPGAAVESWRSDAAQQDTPRAMVSGSLGESPSVNTDFAWPGTLESSATAETNPKWLDRRTVPIIYSAVPAGWVLSTTATPQGLAEVVGRSLLLPRPRAQAVVRGQWSTLQPGSRVSIAGNVFDVQTSSLDFASDKVRLTMGLPRALGVADIETLGSWALRNVAAL